MGSDVQQRQPAANENRVTNYKRFVAGSARSKERLDELQYDPIGELVATYDEICKMIEREIKLRDGDLVVLDKNGKAKNWYPDNLDKLLEKRIRISEALLRYGYGRVPENIPTNEDVIPPLIIQTTKKGEIYHAIPIGET